MYCADIVRRQHCKFSDQNLPPHESIDSAAMGANIGEYTKAKQNRRRTRPDSVSQAHERRSIDRIADCSLDREGDDGEKKRRVPSFEGLRSHD